MVRTSRARRHPPPLPAVRTVLDSSVPTALAPGQPDDDEPRQTTGPGALPSALHSERESAPGSGHLSNPASCPRLGPPDPARPIFDAALAGNDGSTSGPAVRTVRHRARWPGAAGGPGHRLPGDW